MDIEVTSPPTINYNCIAWAAEDDKHWWEPGGYFWPDGILRTYTIKSYIQAYQSLGYQITQDSFLEQGYQKIALYIDANGIPSHASRQLSDGWWTSKLGRAYDVKHPFFTTWPDVVIEGTLYGLSNYGNLAVVMKRKIE